MLTKTQLQHIQDNLKTELMLYIEQRNHTRAEHGTRDYLRRGYSKEQKTIAINAMFDLINNLPGAIDAWQANDKYFRAILEDGSLGLKLTAFYQESRDIHRSGIRALPATNLHDFLKVFVSTTIAKNNQPPTAPMNGNPSTGVLNASRRDAALSDESRDSVVNTRISSIQQLYGDLR